MKLIPNWKDTWRFYSTWMAAAITAFPFAWQNLPDDIKTYVPEDAEPYIMAGMFVALLIGRVIDQP